MAVITDVQRELASAVREALRPGMSPNAREAVRGLTAALLPTVQRLIAEEGKRASAAARMECDRHRERPWERNERLKTERGADARAAALDPAGADSGEGR